jgi:hypothetical protein
LEEIEPARPAGNLSSSSKFRLLAIQFQSKKQTAVAFSSRVRKKEASMSKSLIFLTRIAKFHPRKALIHPPRTGTLSYVELKIPAGRAGSDVTLVVKNNLLHQESANLCV